VGVILREILFADSQSLLGVLLLDLVNVGVLLRLNFTGVLLRDLQVTFFLDVDFPCRFFREVEPEMC
jgi:hypothetical protein